MVEGIHGSAGLQRIAHVFRIYGSWAGVPRVTGEYAPFSFSVESLGSVWYKRDTMDNTLAMRRDRAYGVCLSYPPSALL
jgi:hypothetical protein